MFRKTPTYVLVRRVLPFVQKPPAPDPYPRSANNSVIKYFRPNDNTIYIIYIYFFKPNICILFVFDWGEPVRHPPLPVCFKVEAHPLLLLIRISIFYLICISHDPVWSSTLSPHLPRFLAIPAGHPRDSSPLHLLNCNFPNQTSCSPWPEVSVHLLDLCQSLLSTPSIFIRSFFLRLSIRPAVKLHGKEFCARNDLRPLKLCKRAPSPNRFLF